MAIYILDPPEVFISNNQHNYDESIIPEKIIPDVLFYCSTDLEEYESSVMVYAYQLNLQIVINDVNENEVAKYYSARRSHFIGEPYTHIVEELYDKLQEDIFPVFKEKIKIAWPHGKIIQTRLLLPSIDDFRQAVLPKLSHLGL